MPTLIFTCRQPIKITPEVNDKPQLTALNVRFVITVYSIL